MKALRVHVRGELEGLRYDRDLPEPEVGPGDVRVAVRAVALGFPDLLLLRGQYQFQPELPFSPGGEVAGVVDAVGDGVTRVAVGDEVIAVGIWGGCAEKAVFPETNVIRKPRGISFEVAAATMVAYGTALHAFEDRARLQAGETLLVLGAAGGVGASAIDLGRMMGAQVIAAAAGPEKRALCEKLGAHATIDYATEELKERAKALAPAGVDVIYDAVGGPLSEAAFRAIAWNGRHLVIGFASGTIPKLPLNLPLLKGAAAIGVFWGAFLARQPEASREQLERLAEWVAEGKLSPLVSRTLPLAEGRQALADIAERRVTGRIVLVP
jgi:NADPH2:quinone reductase